MSVQQTIERKVRAAFDPQHLEVINESSMHSVPVGSESHFKVVIVSSAFQGRGLVQRHQAVNRCLADELAGPVHALALETLTAPEWEARGAVSRDSPPCHGGAKKAG